MAFRKFSKPLAGLVHDRRGTVVLIFALALVPMLGVVGLSIDYTLAMVSKSRMQTALDAAALAGVRAARVVTSEKGGTLEKAKTAAAAAAQQYLATNLPNISYLGQPSNKVAFVIKDGNIDANLSYDANMTTSIARLFAIDSFRLRGQTAVSVSLPRYVNTYLLLDNSASMGLAATEASKGELRRLTKDLKWSVAKNCEFACHGPGPETVSTADIASKNNIKLRIHTLRDAAIEAVKSAEDAQRVPGQFKFEVRTFERQTTVQHAMSDDFSSLAKKLEAIDMTRNSTQGNTMLDKALETFAADLARTGATSGDGYLVDKPKIVVVLVSDGVSDDRTVDEYEWKKPLGDRAKPYSAALDTRACTDIKNRDVTLVAIETKFQAIPDNTSYIRFVQPWIPKISSQMKACASPDNYYLADNADTIHESFKTVFEKTVLPTRVTR
ncbi:MAG: pilus assembly protein TadG [Hyphomicrobiales bacterium]|nr:pilus assembly protein TadG [Hyphomicrobiales bacterium]